MSDNDHFVIKAIPSDLITVEEASRIIGKSPATVKRMCVRGQLVTHRAGRQWLISEASARATAAKVKKVKKGGAAKGLGLRDSLARVISDDLKAYTIRVPDVLDYRDVIENKADLLLEVAEKTDGNSTYDEPQEVESPKSPFFTRPSYNLSVADRVAYDAVVEAAAKQIDKVLNPKVYSARLKDRKQPGTWPWIRWRKEVIKAAEEYPFVIATDIVSYFDLIRHSILYNELRLLKGGDEVVKRLQPMLRTWTRGSDTGIPQGPNASRILANYYLHPVDSLMAAETGCIYSRYMDDIRIQAKNRHCAIQALRTLERECRKRGLVLATHKTKLLYHAKTVEADFGDEDLGNLDYEVDTSADLKGVERKLNKVLKDALRKPEKLDRRKAGFALYRLKKIRGYGMRRTVLSNLEVLAQVIGMTSIYLKPVITKPAIQRGLEVFFQDPERNTSEYVSTWLLATIVDGGKASDGIVAYASKVARNRNEPNYHRAIAMSVMALTKQSAHIGFLKQSATDYDPEIRRAAVTALARVGALDRSTESNALRFDDTAEVIKYLKGRQKLPDLV